MRDDDKLYLVAWSNDSSWSVVKGTFALAELLEPYIEETARSGRNGAERAKKAKAVIRSLIEGTLRPVAPGYRNGGQLSNAPQVYAFDTGTCRVELEGEIPDAGRPGRVTYDWYIERISAVYRLPTAPTSTRPGPRR